MTPIEPDVPDGSRLVVFAKDQPQYLPLPVAIDQVGVVTTIWEPTAEELDALLCGGRVRLSVWTFGLRLQPVCLDVLPPAGGVTRES